MKERIRVLVVDDSAFMRKVLVKMLESHEDVEVVGTAMDGLFALDKIEKKRPDVVTLDLEMPRLDGFATLRRIVHDYRLPVVLVSAHTSRGAKATFEGLAAGAVDFVTKPERIFGSPLESLSADLVGKIRVAAKAKVRGPASPPAPGVVPKASLPAPGLAAAREIVGIAVSTGGPNALSQLLAQLDSDLRFGLVIVQHMPEGFTGQFAERLARLSAIDVREAEDGDLVRAGCALVAPGGRHVEVVRRDAEIIVRLTRKDPVRGHRPSADFLFRSLAEVIGSKAVGIVLTGMGEDGAEGMTALREAGGLTLAQDEASSVVYGMPKAAIERGAVQKILPLSDIGLYLNQLSSQQRGSRWIV